MSQKSNFDKISLVVKLLISTIFVFSAVGKLLDPNAATLSLVQLLSLSPEWAKAAVYSLSVLEAGLAIVIWWRVSALLLAVPVLFWGMLLLSYFKGVECGCFGSLPFFSQISMSGHFLLLVGLFLGLYYLAALRETTADSEQKNKEVKTGGSLKWIGVGALALMLAAFLPLPSLHKARQLTFPQIIVLTGAMSRLPSPTKIPPSSTLVRKRSSNSATSLAQ